MFVHSCFATDGPGITKTYLIDENGCVMRPEIIVSPLLRTKDSSGMMYYYFRVQAFKFPGPDDVYFSCSIDLTPLRKTQVTLLMRYVKINLYIKLGHLLYRLEEFIEAGEKGSHR